MKVVRRYRLHAVAALILLGFAVLDIRRGCLSRQIAGERI
jgi:hypothetical protein